MFNTKTDSIDLILKDFTVKAEKLRAISAKKLEEAKLHQQAIEAATARQLAANRDSHRAATVASRIEALLG